MTVKTSLGIAANDVFYFGNAIGDTGNSATDANVTVADETATHAHPKALTKTRALIDDLYDFNRDGKVGPSDEIIVRNNNASGSAALQLITAP